MDLNYLFHRQQVETTRAQLAASANARFAHEHLARCYEAKISQATEGRIRFRASGPLNPARQQNER